MQFPTPICVICRHLHDNQEETTCAAFPSGIPFEILSSQADHHKPYPGDNGIRYAKREDVKADTEKSIIRFALGVD